MTIYHGIIITSHRTRDAKSKKRAWESLCNWQYVAKTAPEWIGDLEKGHTIQPSEFIPKDAEIYTHTEDYWKGTYFIFADADNIKGVEFDKDENDKNPAGVESWTDNKSLYELYPGLKSDAYAVLESVSSVSVEKGTKPHRRYRFVFLYDTLISTPDQYKSLLLGLSRKYPIIPSKERSAAQPVFGNARDNGKAVIFGNILSIPTEPEPRPADQARQNKKRPPQQTANAPKMSLSQWLQEHNIEYTEKPYKNGHVKYQVDCPHDPTHKAPDGWITDEGGRWQFSCSHNSCQGTRSTWTAFKEAHGISKKEWTQQAQQKQQQQRDQPTDDTQEPSSIEPLPVDDTRGVPVFPDTEGELFLGGFQHLYKAYASTHVWSPEMIMAMGLSSLSYLVGRNTTVQTAAEATPEHLNTYILAVGESDLTAKSLAMREIQKHVRHCVDDFTPVSNVQSLEGIVKALNGSLDAKRFCMFDESSVVFANSRREGTKNLLSGLNELWLCPPVYSVARAGKGAIDDDILRDPYVNCWGNIPTLLIPSVFRQSDLIAGTLNRWLPFYISPKRETMRTPCAESTSYDLWIHRLKIANALLEGRRFVFSEEADNARFAWYEGLRTDAIRTGAQTGESRFHTHAVKMAGLFAIADNGIEDNAVKKIHWETALTVVRYLHDCYEYLYRGLGATRKGEFEQRLLDLLNQNGNEMSLTEINRSTQGFDSEERESIFQTLEKQGVLIRCNEKTTGRPVTKIRRVQ